MSSPSTILTEEHLAQLNNAIDQSAQIQREINLAKQAGLDVSTAQATLDQTTANLRQIKSVYFPGR